ncbi:MAG: glycoside hydrolase family 15 protein [Rhodospirillaceae bacterium]|jgi:GH15 family glucan-1,4-alpha-glucosidase|nr:glycoside hydrolase family 15 protein [Rhodospirillaceae bacterium]MBT5047462.1 glycoside hydrolase family 15 protein [Rhodospirillaceae bacterium]MBT5456103.1 glycoside hydrolase family 15 protein [Rhodospirillaceae bacterium]
MSDLNLAVIGNCSFSALLDDQAKIVWSCMPRYDDDPIFCSLMDGGQDSRDHGYFEIEVEDFARSEQCYLYNTAIVVTTLYDTHGSALEITDFTPRFKQRGRTYRPVMIVRRLRAVIGNPRIKVRIKPAMDYGARQPEVTHGSNHIRYVIPNNTVRLTTDVPISFVLKEVPFILEEPMTMILGPDETLDSGIEETARDFIERTTDYWREWCSGLSLPFEWQEEVIRAAITLKLCTFEESGAVIAAMTTSIPEAPGTERNWDYRYCWLRDSYFVVHALNRLGATRTMQEYLRYITNVAATADDGHLQPVYSVTLDSKLIERTETNLSGYRGNGPVRVGNQAYEHIQNDVYGSVIMAATQMFFDVRMAHPGTGRMFERLEAIGEQAAKLFDQPDAGIWEFRTIAKVHTFSAAMCWAACDRLARIADHLQFTGRAEYWHNHAKRMHKKIIKDAWNSELNSFVDCYGGKDLDASLLLLHHMGFVEATDPRFVGTVEAIEKYLKRGDLLLRYAAPDDFGTPDNAFTVCTFWYIDALAAIGRQDEARELFEKILSHRNHVGLLSEDLDPNTGELWGNFPQTYSMVGLITSAMRLSKSWEEAF